MVACVCDAQSVEVMEKPESMLELKKGGDIHKILRCILLAPLKKQG